MKLSNIAIGLALVLTPAVAYAGYTHAYPPTISGSSAYGSVVSARGTADANAMVSCSTHNYPAGGAWGTCNVTTSTGVSASCFTSDPAVLTAMRSLDNQSYLQITWDGTGQCTEVFVATGSLYKP
jgi:hypothetical protein